MKVKEFDKEIRLLSRLLKRLVIVLVGLGVVVYFLSGIYSVQTGETGIAKSFGKVVESKVPPGIHYRFPWPFQTVHRVTTSEIKRIEAGFGAPEDKVEKLETVFGSIDTMQYGTLLIPYALAGDKNIIHIHIIAAYQIVKPVEYSFDFIDPERVLTLLIQQHLLSDLSTMHVDEVLLTGKTVLKQRLTQSTQESVDRLGLGIRLVTVDIKRSRPPRQVEAAFKDVIDAQEQRTTAVHDAESYRNELLPQAKAEAARIVTEAQAYADKKIAQADGESQRYKLIEKEYRQDPELVAKRVYLEQIPGILKDVETFVPGAEAIQRNLELNLFAE